MAKRGPAKGEGGRPPKPIDWEEAAKLAYIQCTAAEIAAWFKISPDTLSLRCEKDNGETYSEWYKKHSENGKSSLRRSLWKLATGPKPHATIAIWLSKQYLGMRDQLPEITDQRPVIIKSRNGTTVQLGTQKVELINEDKKDGDTIEH